MEQSKISVQFSFTPDKTKIMGSIYLMIDNLGSTLFTCSLSNEWKSSDVELIIRESPYKIKLIDKKDQNENEMFPYYILETGKLENKSFYICNLRPNGEVKISKANQTFRNKKFEILANCRVSIDQAISFISLFNHKKVKKEEVEAFINKYSEEEEIPNIFDVEKSDYLTEVTRIMLYRLKVIIDNKIFPNDEDHIKRSILYICEIYPKILENKGTYARFLITLILHCSRAFLDPDSNSLKVANDILENNIEKVLPTNFKTIDEVKLIDNTNVIENSLGIIREIMITDNFKYKLSTFLKEHVDDIKDWESSISSSLEFISSLLDNLIFVENAYFYGMCGLEGEIYISLEHISRILNKESYLVDDLDIKKSSVFLVATILHESAHSLLRMKFMKNRLKSSPKAKSDNEKMESGYKFEKILFGEIISDFVNAESIINISKWKSNTSDTPILSNDEMKIQTLSSSTLNKNFSGISVLPIRRMYR